MTEAFDPFDPGVIAADYAIASLGPEAARLALVALRAGWLTEAEAESLLPLARGLSLLLEVELPPHRGEGPSPSSRGRGTYIELRHKRSGRRARLFYRRQGPAGIRYATVRWLDTGEIQEDLDADFEEVGA